MSSDSTNTNNNKNDFPNLYSGQYHSVKGTLVETVGNLTGSDSWKKSGREEHVAGEGEIQEAQAKGYAEGATDLISGKIDSIFGAVTGNTSDQKSGIAKHDAGKAKMEANKPVA